MFVRDTPPPTRPVMTIGRIYDIVQKPEPEAELQRVQIEEEADDNKAESEVKVVRPRRGRRVKANEDAETK